MIADYSHGMAKETCSGRRRDSRTAHSVFFDEPFEGVDALGGGALKALLARMTDAAQRFS